MSDQLICCIDMFSTTQVLMTPEGEKIIVEDFNKLCEFALAYCIEHNVPKLHFFGEEKYISGLLERKTELMFGCKNNNVQIEVK